MHRGVHVCGREWQAVRWDVLRDAGWFGCGWCGGGVGGGPGGDLGAGGEAEFGEDVFDVAFGGALGDDELGRYLLVAQSLGDEVGDLKFTAGQWGCVLGEMSRGGGVGGGLAVQGVGNGLIEAELDALAHGVGEGSFAQGVVEQFPAFVVASDEVGDG